MDWFTVIPTKDRPTELGNLLDSLAQNCIPVRKDRVLIINNGFPDGIPEWVREADIATIVQDQDRNPHIYGMWNVGLAWAERQATQYLQPDQIAGLKPGSIRPHAVAILNDDVELPPDFAARMIECLRDTDATIAFPDQGPGIVNQFPGAGMHGQAQKRITGYAFVVNGTHGIRCDEDFKWWYGDDDLDWQARRDFNGTWEVDVTVKHLHPGKSTNASASLQAQSAADRSTFISKWGRAPW